MSEYTMLVSLRSCVGCVCMCSPFKIWSKSLRILWVNDRLAVNGSYVKRKSTYKTGRSFVVTSSVFNENGSEITKSGLIISNAASKMPELIHNFHSAGDLKTDEYGFLNRRKTQSTTRIKINAKFLKKSEQN